MISVNFSLIDRLCFSRAERHLIKEIATVTEARVRQLLPQLTNRIKMTVKTGSMVIPETGEVGSAVGKQGCITWTVDPSRTEGVLEIVKAHLRPTLFHELNHVMRKQGQSQESLRQRTLLDIVVSEGLATTFERDEGGRCPLWGQYPSDVEDWVDELINLPPDTVRRHWMFRHPDGRRWIGYRSGTYVVDQAAKHSGLSPVELVEIPTREIFQLAGFKI